MIHVEDQLAHPGRGHDEGEYGDGVDDSLGQMRQQQGLRSKMRLSDHDVEGDDGDDGADGEEDAQEEAAGGAGAVDAHALVPEVVLLVLHLALRLAPRSCAHVVPHHVQNA